MLATQPNRLTLTSTSRLVSDACPYECQLSVSGENDVIRAAIREADEQLSGEAAGRNLTVLNELFAQSGKNRRRCASTSPPAVKRDRLRTTLRFGDFVPIKPDPIRTLALP
jgi:hypothetical protein